MKCSDCIHHEVCDGYKAFDVETEHKKCDDFRDKSLFIELPCKIGDRFYRCTKLTNGIQYHTYIVEDIEYIENEIRIMLSNYGGYMTPDELAEEMFATKEEAEKSIGIGG